MSKQPGWMPVFVVVQAPAQAVVSVPSGKGKGRQLRAKLTRSGKDYWQRIGTARLQADGSWNVQLTAIPVNGRFVIRAPRAKEFQDPTKQREE
jgi:hypothetical protein